MIAEQVPAEPAPDGGETAPAEVAADEEGGQEEAVPEAAPEAAEAATAEGDATVPASAEAPAEEGGEAPAAEGEADEAAATAPATAEGGEEGGHKEAADADAAAETPAEAAAPAEGEGAQAADASLDESAAVEESEGGAPGLGAAFQGEVTRKLPDARQIEVDRGNGAPPEIISLIVEHELQRKPYYGGYRHKLTGVEYHHAVCQTEALPKPKLNTQDMPPPKFHRETQTRKIKEQAQQAVREFGTQMTREDHFVEARDDYVIEARPYLDSEHFSKVRLSATVVIQCYTRGMFARQLARQSRAQLAWNRQYFLDEQARERRAERDREVERRMHPKNGADFEILYNELEAWRVAETQVRAVLMTGLWQWVA